MALWAWLQSQRVRDRPYDRQAGVVLGAVIVKIDLPNVKSAALAHLGDCGERKVGPTKQHAKYVSSSKKAHHVRLAHGDYTRAQARAQTNAAVGPGWYTSGVYALARKHSCTTELAMWCYFSVNS